MRETRVDPVEWVFGSATDPAFVFSVDGEDFPRSIIRANGVSSFGDGTTNPTTTQSSAIPDASVAHALNSEFSDTEVEGALDALGGKINLIIAALEAAGILASS